MDEYLVKGSIWIHRNLKLEARIIEIIDSDTFLLGWVESSDRLADMLLWGSWSTMELVLDFTPKFQDTRWTRLREGNLPYREST